MDTQKLTFAYDLNAYFAITGGNSLPACVLGEGESYTSIEIEYPSDTAPPTHDTCTWKRLSRTAGGARVLEFELHENATNKTTCFHLNRDRITAHRVYYGS